ncbi:putative leucine-rich repeat-containing protein DDB_G0290503 [Ambystoma mexicanum]|uniref:putative leucine-rich repeat-containing protein DDB_G0290503 n=1 Tax=Ambystoma mexicanum TaxID=8296 RepID=UPI0037E93F3F
MHNKDSKASNSQTQKEKDHALGNSEKSTSKLSEENSIATTEGDPTEMKACDARRKERLIMERAAETPRRRDSIELADQVLRGLVEMNSNLAKRRRNSETHSCGRTTPQAEWQRSKEKSLHDVMALEANTPSFEFRNEEIAVSQKRCRRKLSSDLELEGGHKRFKSNTRRSLTPTPKRVREQIQSQVPPESEGEVESLHSKKKRQQHETTPMATHTSDEVTTLVETIIGRLSPVLMSATTIAVAPLLKLYENLNESLRDQTTLVALLNSKIVKLEIDLTDMAAQVVETRRGNDISLTALRESVKATIEDKRLLAEVTKQALTLLQKDREQRAEANKNRLPAKIQLNPDITHDTTTIDSNVTALTNEETTKLKSAPTRTMKHKSSCSVTDLETPSVMSDSPEKSKKTKDPMVGVSERGNIEKNNKKKESIKESKDGGKNMNEISLKIPTKKKRPQEMDTIETIQTENEEEGCQSVAVDNTRTNTKGKEMRQTSSNNKVNAIAEKKNEVEWFDIFEPRNSKKRSSLSLKNNPAILKQSNQKKKSKNQQGQKAKNSRSAANFFRNIKALTITVNNTEPTGTNNKKSSLDSSEASTITAIEELPKGKTRQIEKTKDERKTKTPVTIEEESEDDENLLNMSTYSLQADEEVDENNASETIDECETTIQQDKRRGEPTLTCKTPTEPEQESATGKVGKRVFQWPVTPKKVDTILKNKEPKEENGKHFCTLEEKRKRSTQQQKKTCVASKPCGASSNPTFKDTKCQKKSELQPITVLLPKNQKKTDKAIEHSWKSQKEENSTRYRILVEKIDHKQSDPALNRYSILQIFQKIPTLRTLKSPQIDRVEIIADSNQKFVLLHIAEKKVAERIMTGERQLLNAGYQVYEVDNALGGNDCDNENEKGAQLTTKKEAQMKSQQEKNIANEAQENKIEENEEGSGIQHSLEEIKQKKIRITVVNFQDPKRTRCKNTLNTEEDSQSWRWIAKSLNEAPMS